MVWIFAVYEGCNLLLYRAMVRDPEIYSDPDVFDPERFLDSVSPEMEPSQLVFGFGRR